MENNSVLFKEMSKCYEVKWEVSVKNRRKLKLTAHEAEFQDPYSNGEWDAYSAVKHSESSKYVLLDNSCWDGGHADFVKTLIRFGIDSFVIVYDGIGVFTDIYEFLSVGCTLVKAITVIKEARFTCSENDVKVRGLLFKLPILSY